MQNYLETIVAALAAAAIALFAGRGRPPGDPAVRPPLAADDRVDRPRAPPVPGRRHGRRRAVRRPVHHRVRGRRPSWRRLLLHLLVLGVIATIAWLVASLLVVAEDTALARFRVDVPDNRHARRVRTQVVMLRRLTIAVIVDPDRRRDADDVPRRTGHRRRCADLAPVWSVWSPRWPRRACSATSSPASSSPSATRSASTTWWWSRGSGAGSRS